MMGGGTGEPDLSDENEEGESLTKVASIPNVNISYPSL